MNIIYTLLYHHNVKDMYREYLKTKNTNIPESPYFI